MSDDEKQIVEARRQHVYRRYLQWLDALSSLVGGRNNALMRGAKLAKHAGVSREAFTSETINAGGEPRLTVAEVGRAWERCEAEPITLAHLEYAQHREIRAIPKPWERPPSHEECEFVRRQIQDGKALIEEARRTGGNSSLKASDLLRGCSPINIPQDSVAQAVALMAVLAMCADAYGMTDGGKWFAGERYEAKTPNRVLPPSVLAKGWVDGAGLPTYISVNPHTGNGVATRGGDQRESYRCAATVASWMFTLVEFDELPLDVQAAFWLGVTSNRVLPVASLVYSGGKSIHGIVVVPETGAGAWGTEKNYKAAWGNIRNPRRLIWGELSRILCSDADSRYHADVCAASVLTTRLAGHMRTDPARSRKSRQCLLWLASVSDLVSRRRTV